MTSDYDRCFYGVTGTFEDRPMTVPCDLPRRLHPIDGKLALEAHDFMEAALTQPAGEPRCKHRRSKPLAGEIEWCQSCGAVKWMPLDGDDWMFPAAAAEGKQ